MNTTAKTLIVLGCILIAAGLLAATGIRLPLGRLPGDIAIKKENFSFYFPLATCIVLSALLTAVFWLVRFFTR
ncbi:MAG TPA: DUF2905 domain-containing protein [Firmicutes bacterium]|nr:DUF2905 domain-containing protein [Bacillota bacterium]